MARLGISRSVEILLEARDDDESASSERYVDLVLAVCVADVDTSGAEPRWIPGTDEELVELGGRWDRQEKRWSHQPHTRRAVVRVPRGSDQEQPARWLGEWFRRWIGGGTGPHWAERGVMLGGREEAIEFIRAWVLMLYGGRRGGKTTLAVLALLMMSVCFPGARAYAISPTQAETDELEQELVRMAPRHWYRIHSMGAGKSLQYRFAHGSRVLYISGHKPRGLKRGRMDIALYNEAQDQYHAGYKRLRGAIVDKAGLVILACNPPDAPIGRWVEELFERARAQDSDRKTRTRMAQAFKLVGKHNPFVSQESLADMREEMSDVDARREVDGEMGIAIGDVVWHAFSSTESVREVPPNLVDVTAEVTQREFGAACGYIVGMDFQKTPAMVAILIKVFRDPEDVQQELLLWVVDEVLVEKGDEYQLCDALEGERRWTRTGKHESETYRGWAVPEEDREEPRRCAVVMDASGFFQDGAHNRGKTSDLALKTRGWKLLFAPHKGSDRNPDILERCKVTNRLLKAADSPDGKVLGRRRLFFVPTVLKTIEAMKLWELRNGIPYRQSVYAHVSDGVSYPVFRLFGKPKQKASGGYVSVAKISNPLDGL